MIYDGFKVKVNNKVCIRHEFVQVNFPKRKNNRVRKKWARNKANYVLAEAHVGVKCGDTLFVSSEVYENMKIMNKNN